MSDEYLNYLGHRPWWSFWLNIINVVFWLSVSIATFVGFSVFGIVPLVGMWAFWQIIETQVARWQQQNPVPDKRLSS